MMAGIQQDSLGSGIHAACRRQCGIEGYRDVDIELILYLFCGIGLIIQHDDGEGDPVVIFSYHRFEKGYVETGTGTIGIKEMQEHGFIPGNGQLSGQIDIGAGCDRMILRGNRCR